jgi:hypothetical protein
MQRVFARLYKPVAPFPRPVIRGFVLEQALLTVGALVSMAWMVEVSPFALWPAALVPAAVLLAVPLLFVRVWPVWDLLAWMSGLPSSPDADASDADRAHLSELYRAVVARRPEDLRARLAVLDSSSLRVRAIASYYAGLADLWEGRAADLKALSAAAAEAGIGPWRAAAVSLRALLEAGSEDLAGRDWRGPLLACRKELGLRFSLWRGLWPIRWLMIGYWAILVGLVLFPYGLMP